MEVKTVASQEGHFKFQNQRQKATFHWFEV